MHLDSVQMIVSLAKENWTDGLISAWYQWKVCTKTGSKLSYWPTAACKCSRENQQESMYLKLRCNIDHTHIERYADCNHGYSTVHNQYVLKNPHLLYVPWMLEWNIPKVCHWHIRSSLYSYYRCSGSWGCGALFCITLVSVPSAAYHSIALVILQQQHNMWLPFHILPGNEDGH